ETTERRRASGQRAGRESCFRRRRAPREGFASAESGERPKTYPFAVAQRWSLARSAFDARQGERQPCPTKAMSNRPRVLRAFLVLVDTPTVVTVVTREPRLSLHRVPSEGCRRKSSRADARSC